MCILLLLRNLFLFFCALRMGYRVLNMQADSALWDFLCLTAQYITQQLYITAYYACFFEI